MPQQRAKERGFSCLNGGQKRGGFHASMEGEGEGVFMPQWRAKEREFSCLNGGQKRGGNAEASYIMTV